VFTTLCYSKLKNMSTKKSNKGNVTIDLLMYVLEKLNGLHMYSIFLPIFRLVMVMLTMHSGADLKR